MAPQPNYKDIVARYEKCFSKHGDSHLGIDWPNQKDAEIRYDVMLKDTSGQSILDFGCGPARMLDYIYSKEMNVIYRGLDINPESISCAKQKYPDVEFVCCDPVESDFVGAQHVIMNGVFTIKETMPFEDMKEYTFDLISKAWNVCSKRLSVNFMSPFVDWCRPYLFHLPVDTCLDFATKLSRNCTIRHDYGLYEYTLYIHRME